MSEANINNQRHHQASIYEGVNLQPVNLHHHQQHGISINNDDNQHHVVEDVVVHEDDDVAVGEEESIDNPSRIRYDNHNSHHHHQHNTLQNSGSIETGMEDMSVQPHALYVQDAEIQPVSGGVAGAGGGGGADQLTLSFQGEVYVFDAVSPEKVYSLSMALGFCLLILKMPCSLFITDLIEQFPLFIVFFPLFGMILPMHAYICRIES